MTSGGPPGDRAQLSESVLSFSPLFSRDGGDKPEEGGTDKSVTSVFDRGLCVIVGRWTDLD